MTVAQRPMPVAFFGHGSPANTLAHNKYTGAWKAFAATLPAPRAVVAVSAHWYVRGVRVSAAPRPATIHDFNARSDRSLFAFDYPAPGSIELARRIADLLAPTPVAADVTWGIDHGAYSVLAHIFPGADVPVVQLALDRTMPADEHYRMAARLAPLRDDGVLIVGSGNVVHNLELADFRPNVQPFSWARRQSERLRTMLEAGDHEQLIRYRAGGDDAKLAVPTPDHYLPFLYALAQQRPGETWTTISEGVEGGSLDMLSIALGA